MDFLKKEIFYPVKGEHNLDLINDTCLQYDIYLNSIKDKLPKSLLKYYFSENRFHDFAIQKISFLGNANFYKEQRDKIIVELVLSENEIEIEFCDVSFFALLNDGENSCWRNINGVQKYNLVQLEEIVLCELGLKNEKVFKFEFLSSSGCIFKVHFSKVKVKKRICKV